MSDRVSHLFVLDVSPWSTKTDQTFAYSHDEQEEKRPSKTRLEAQVEAMKLLSCVRMPTKVGVLHMGSEEDSVKVDVKLTEKWKKQEGKIEKSEPSKAILANYAAASEAPSHTSETQEISRPDPNRILVALETCFEALQEDLKENSDAKEGSSAPHTGSGDKNLYPNMITVFLCSPPVDMAQVKSDLQIFMRRLENAPFRAEVELVLHPNAYSFESLEMFRKSEHWNHYDAETDYSPDTRCSEEDIHILETTLHFAINTNVSDPDFVRTLCSMSQTYIQRSCYQSYDQDVIYRRWQECFFICREDSSSFIESHQFPKAFWDYAWTYDEEDEIGCLEGLHSQLLRHLNHSLECEVG